MENDCLICYQKLESGIYHTHCSKKFFGDGKPPVMEYSLNNIKDLAKSAISRSLSVTGVQEKISLAIAKKQKQNKLTIVGLWGNYILKPPSERFPELPAVEHLTMKMAEAVQIPTVPNALIRMKSGELAYLTRRIDRDKKRKIHMEDMCQLSGRLTEDKYRSSMEQISKIVKNKTSFPGLDLIYLYEQTLFSFLTGNADMHLKNFSLFYPASKILLAPAYDLVSTRLLISEKDDPEELALTLNGKKSNFKLQDFLSFGEYIGLNKKQIDNIHQKLFHADKPWNQLIQQSFLSAELKNNYLDLIRKRIKRLK